LKQTEFKNHIEEVLNRKIWQIEEIYKTKKEEIVKKNYEKKKNEVPKALKPLIDSLKKDQEALIKEAEKINYGMGTFTTWGDYNEPDMRVPEIKEQNINQSIKEDFEKEYDAKKAKLKE